MHSTVGRARQSLGEEIADGVSHGIGLLAALVGAPVLLLAAVRAWHQSECRGGRRLRRDSRPVVSRVHALSCRPPWSRKERISDARSRATIFLLIAGTYTPFTLGVLRGTWGWLLFGLVWSLAAVGVLLRVTGVLRHPVLSTSLDLTMGWLALIAVRPSGSTYHQPAYSGCSRAASHTPRAWPSSQRGGSATPISSGTSGYSPGPAATSSRCCGTQPDPRMSRRAGVVATLR